MSMQSVASAAYTFAKRNSLTHIRKTRWPIGKTLRCSLIPGARSSGNPQIRPLLPQPSVGGAQRQAPAANELVLFGREIPHPRTDGAGSLARLRAG
jgi:hypothetical protein